MKKLSIPSKIQYAGFWRRFVAYWIDLLIIFPLGLTIQQLIGAAPLAMLQAKTIQDLQQIQQSPMAKFSTFINIIVVATYYMVMWVNFNGATPGEKLMAVKIIKENGKKLTYTTAFIRYLGYMLSSFVFLLGFFWIMWDKKKQGWHDKLAGTVVVKTNEKPKTLLAILLTFIAITLFCGYIFLFTYKVVKLTVSGVSEGFSTVKNSKTLKEMQESMSPGAKVHYQKTQELFSKMRKMESAKAVMPVADETITEAKKATELEPGNAMLWNNLGDAYTWPNTIGSKESALESYKKAEELEPNNTVWMNVVGDELLRLGRFDDSILQFQKTLRITQRSGYAYLSLGKAYKGLGIIDEARKHFEKAIEIFKDENSEGKYDEEILEAQKELGAMNK